jgi:hypothetical protein
MGLFIAGVMEAGIPISSEAMLGLDGVRLRGMRFERGGRRESDCVYFFVVRF